jgi:hypothetical protein
MMSIWATAVQRATVVSYKQTSARPSTTRCEQTGGTCIIYNIYQYTTIW